MATRQSIQGFGQNLSQAMQVFLAALARKQQLDQIEQARSQAFSPPVGVGGTSVDFNRRVTPDGAMLGTQSGNVSRVRNQVSLQPDFQMQGGGGNPEFLRTLLMLATGGNQMAKEAIPIQMAGLPRRDLVSGPRGQITEAIQDPFGGPSRFNEVRPGENPLLERARQELGTSNLTQESREGLNRFIASGGQGEFPPVNTEQRVPTEFFDDPQDNMRYKVIRNPYTGEEIRRQKVGPTPPTAEMRNKSAARVLVGNSIDAVRDLSRQIITKVGPAQRIDAIKRGADAVFGNDPSFRTYQDARMALAGNLAVAQQGSRPSDADIQAIWLPLVPDPYRDTQESMEMKWKLIDTMSLPERKNGKDGSGQPKPTHRFNPATGKIEPIQ